MLWHLTELLKAGDEKTDRSWKRPANGHGAWKGLTPLGRSTLLLRNHAGQREVTYIFKVLKEKILNPESYIWQKRKTHKKTFSVKGKLREYVVHRPIVNEWLKEIL